jgi:mevalonate kinase
MLSGEYAVLYGGTAILSPVPRWVEISEVNFPPMKPYPPAVEVARTLPIRELDEFEYKFGIPYILIDRSDVIELLEGGMVLKLGLGSSAAEAVGTVALRYERAGIPWRAHRNEIVRLAMEAHRIAQKGKGSGADVAVCALGEPIRFQPATEKGQKTKIEPLTMPTRPRSVPMHLVWSRQPADTRELVGQFERWAGKDKHADVLIQKLVALSHALARAWFVAAKDEFFEQIDQFYITLQQCADAAGMDYRLPIHEELEAWALGYGGRAKPTGAGGGDMILLLGDLPLDQLEGQHIISFSPLEFIDSYKQ